MPRSSASDWLVLPSLSVTGAPRMPATALILAMALAAQAPESQRYIVELEQPSAAEAFARDQAKSSRAAARLDAASDAWSSL